MNLLGSDLRGLSDSNVLWKLDHIYYCTDLIKSLNIVTHEVTSLPESNSKCPLKCSPHHTLHEYGSYYSCGTVTTLSITFASASNVVAKDYPNGTSSTKSGIPERVDVHRGSNPWRTGVPTREGWRLGKDEHRSIIETCSIHKN